MGRAPSLEEIEATVARLEDRYRATPLFAVYERLCLRFEVDLSDRRDLAIAKSAALMLIQFEMERPS